MDGIGTASAETLTGTGLQVVFLGTKGGPPPNADSAGIASAVIVDGSVYLVDVGRAAVTQYARSGLRFENLRGVFITHLHADHIADYFNLFLLAGYSHREYRDALPDRTPVFGPGSAGGLPPAFEGGDVGTVSPAEPTPGIARLTDLAAAAFAYSTNVFVRDSGVRETRGLAEVHEIDVAGTGATFENTSPVMDPIPVFEDPAVRVTAVLVPHGPVFPAFAYRFDTVHGSVTFSGDTTYSDNLVRLATGTDLLVHEAINVDGFRGPAAFVGHLLEGHVEVQRLGGIAQAAGAKRLAVSHIADLVHGAADPIRWATWAQAGYEGPVHVARDLDVITVA
ncbi:MAG: MBL fold metallo-hydrolase [Pseudolysinimonas sp.]